MKQALRHYQLPVIINHIKDVLAVDDWIHGSMDPTLRSFSRQHNDWNPGMHSARLDLTCLYFCRSCILSKSLRFIRGEAPGSVKCFFRMFKQDSFPLIVFEAAQHNYWTGGDVSSENFFPRVVYVESKWEEHSVLVRDTVGSPLISPRIAGWEDGLDKCLRECHQDLNQDSTVFRALRRWWTEYVGLRKGVTPGSIASGQFVIAAASDIWHVPSLPRIAWEHRAALPAAQVIAADASIAPHRRTMGSSMGSSERAVPRPRDAVEGALEHGLIGGRGGRGGRGRSQ